MNSCSAHLLVSSPLLLHLANKIEILGKGDKNEYVLVKKRN